MKTKDCGVWRHQAIILANFILAGWLMMSPLLNFYPPKRFGKLGLPLNFQVFLWALAQGKFNSGEVIQGKLPNMCLSPSCCMMGKTSAESSNHLFLHWFMASKSWNRLCRKANILWVIQVLVTLYLWRIPLLLAKEKSQKSMELRCGSFVLGNMKSSYFWRGKCG